MLPIAQFGKIHISGYPAWLAWLFVHIFFPIGFRNRLIVLFQWRGRISLTQGSSLITGDTTLPGWAELKAQSPSQRRSALAFE